MSRIATALVLSVLLVAACAPSVPSTPAPSPATPTVAPSGPSPSPSGPVAPTPDPTASPSPTAPSVGLTPEERALLDGVLRDAIDCEPVRSDLPPGAIAGIECASDDPDVARIGFYRFPDDATMLDAYFARMRAEGIATDSGPCSEGEGEGAYVPWGDDVPAPDRHGCFLNEEGYANYRYTVSGPHLYVGILGRNADLAALEAFAFRGSVDTPGNPTLWGEPAN